MYLLIIIMYENIKLEGGLKHCKVAAVHTRPAGSERRRCACGEVRQRESNRRFLNRGFGSLI